MRNGDVSDRLRPDAYDGLVCNPLNAAPLFDCTSIISSPGEDAVRILAQAGPSLYRGPRSFPLLRLPTC